jgi:Mn-dependent DtxR family transcriptional regulator
MSRKQKVLETAEKLIQQGKKPSAKAVSQELSWAEEDVHRCLNLLEKSGEVETYPREALGMRMRMVSVYR